MSKRDELIAEYEVALREKCGIEPDMPLLRAVTIGLGPSIYRANASVVSGRNASELQTVRRNFLMGKLGLEDGPALDAGLETVMAQYDAGESGKYRAVVYYLLTKHFGREAVYGVDGATHEEKGDAEEIVEAVAVVKKVGVDEDAEDAVEQVVEKRVEKSAEKVEPLGLASEGKPADEVVAVDDRERLAEEIIRSHMMWSLGSGLIPIPLVDLTAVTALQTSMLEQLADLYEVDEYSRSSGKSFVSALVGTGLASIGASLVKTIPVVGTLVGAIAMPVSAAASTYGLGQAAVRQFSSGRSLVDVDMGEAREVYDEALDEGQALAEAMKEEG